MLKSLPLAFKLTLALALTVVVAVGAVSLLANRSAARHFEDYFSTAMRPRLSILVPLLAEYYEAQGSWDGLDQVLIVQPMGGGMMGMGAQRGQGSMMSANAANLIVTDAKGRVIFDSAKLYIGRRLGPRVLERSQPIQIDGQIVGYVLAGAGPQEQAFSQRLNTSILWAGLLAGIVAIGLGLLLTRIVTQPLRAVRDAARRIGAGELSHRVPIMAHDEIGDVAQQFNEMAAALERDEELRRKMTADIAHELRTPLAVLRGQVEALEDGVFELSAENLAPIHDQVMLLGRLVDDLRDLALAEAGRLSLERADVALGGLVERVAAAYRSRAQEKAVTLITELQEPLPMVFADSQRLEQVLGNLLSNALRYTPSGGRVVVRAWADEQGATLAVQDSGVGIAPDDLPHVFERFYRADPSRSRADGGSGLGLAIVKQIVEAHGGQVEVQSLPEQGATFTVRLPVEKS